MSRMLTHTLRLCLLALFVGFSDAAVASVSLVAGTRLLSSSTGNAVVIQLTPSVAVDNDFKFVIAFPTGFAFPAPAATAEQGIDGTLACTAATNTLTCTRAGDGTQTAAGAALRLELAAVTASATAGATTGLTVEVTNAADASQDAASAAVAGPAVYSGLGACSLTPTDLFRGTTQTVTIAVGTLATSLAATDELVVYFPTGVTFSNPVTTISGDTIASTTAAGHVLTIVMGSAATMTASASLSFTVTNANYPSAALLPATALEIRTQSTGGATPKDMTETTTHAATVPITSALSSVPATLAIGSTSTSITVTLDYAVPVGLSMSVDLSGTPSQHMTATPPTLTFAVGETTKTFTVAAAVNAGLGALNITLTPAASTDEEIYDSSTATLNVEAGAAAGLLMTTTAAAGLIDTAFPSALVVAVVDAGGNPLTGFTDAVTVTATGPGTLTGTATQNLDTSTGLATFGDLQADALGDYTLSFAATLAVGARTVTQAASVVDVPTSLHAAATIDKSLAAAGTLPTVEVSLRPYITGSTPTFVCLIKTLPAVGTLYQLAEVYAKYGYAPKLGAVINATDTYVTDPQHRVIYEAPLGFSTTRFTYLATSERVAEAAAAANVDIVTTASGGELVASHFHQDAEGWMVTRASSAAAAWSGTSFGGLSMYVVGEDGQLTVGQNNNKMWFFQAPAAFHGNFALAYSGTLEFWIAPLAGDFTSARRANPRSFVELECSSCDSGAGVILAQRSVVWTGSAYQFSFNLDTSGGWTKDPKDTLQTAWAAATQCELFDVLSAISSLRIYGDHTTGYEAVALDLVTIKLGPTPAEDTCYA